MKYTERLKLAIAADILFMCVLAILSVIAIKDIWSNFGLLFIILLVVGGSCVAVSLYTEQGECRKWRRIWKDPIWQISGYIVIAIKLIISIWVFPESEYFYSVLWVLMMANALLRDIRYYRNAVRFGMDDLKDVNELASKYPEARPMINRKKKTDKEKE